MLQPDRLFPTTGRTLVMWNGDDDSMGEIDVIEMPDVCDALDENEPLEHAECKFNRDGTATMTGNSYRCRVHRVDALTLDLVYTPDIESSPTYYGTVRLRFRRRLDDPLLNVEVEWCEDDCRAFGPTTAVAMWLP